MPKIIHLRVKKELDSTSMQKVLKLKGTLIKECFTEIIHIADENEEYHLNFFTISIQDKQTVEDFIQRYIIENNLEDFVTLITGSIKPAFHQE